MTISLALVVEFLKEFLHEHKKFRVEVEDVYDKQKQEEKKNCACNASDDDSCNCATAQSGQCR